MSTQICQRCGGTLERDPSNPHQLKCKYCRRICDSAVAERRTETLRALFDAAKLELVNNLRRNLYDALTAQYISSGDVRRICDELKMYLPDDFSAGFYRTVAGGNLRQINQAILDVDVEARREDMDDIVEFLIRSINGDNDYLLALGDLIERAYKGYDLRRYSHYSTILAEQVDRVRDGVYETALPRDVFVAYSGKDREAVLELTEALEEQGISCFVALRNLRHGVGSVEDYSRALREAMDNCTIFLFVSSMNSRNLQCDAVREEMMYIKNQDLAAAPSEYGRRYERIPHKYKKPRVEYRMEESPRLNIADKTTDQFFDGYERVYEIDGILERVASILMGDGTDYEEEARQAEEAARRAEEEARRVEEETRRRVEEETRRRVEEETRRRVEEETRRRVEEEARRRMEEEARARAEEEARRAASYKIRMVSCGRFKLNVIKVLQDFFGWGLAETKNVVESIPTTIPKSLPREQAEELRRQLQAYEVGVELIPDVSVAKAPSLASAQPPATEYNVRLLDSGMRKLPIVKMLREFLGIGLAEAKNMADSTPRIIAEGFTRERAEELCRLLQAEGATVRVEPCQKY